MYLLGYADLTFRAESNDAYLVHNTCANGAGAYVRGKANLTFLSESNYEIFVTSNHALTNGGGVCVTETGVVAVVGHVNIGGNSARYGGGVYADEKTRLSLSATNGYGPFVYNNAATNYGGGIAMQGASAAATLRGVTIGGESMPNTAEYGGGMAVSQCDMELINCVMKYNESVFLGGAIHDYQAHVRIRSVYDADDSDILPPTKLYANYTGLGGGMIYAEDAHVEISDAYIYSNLTSAASGGTIRLEQEAELELYNVLMVNPHRRHVQAYDSNTCVRIFNSTLINGPETNVAITLDDKAKLEMTNAIVRGTVTSGQTVNYCDIPDTYAGTGNITNAPEFMDTGNSDYRLRYGSPCINQGTSIAWMTNDIMNGARPIDAYDMGAYEYDGDVYDSDGDQMVDNWETNYLLNPLNAADAAIDTDLDTYTNLEEYVADTNPRDIDDYFHIVDISRAGQTNQVVVPSSAQRVYSLAFCDEIVTGAWGAVTGQTQRPGSGGQMTLMDTNAPSCRCYRATVQLP